MSSKAAIKLLFSLTTVIVILMLAYIIVMNVKKSGNKEIQVIPSFSFINVLNNIPFTNEDIAKEKVCLIIYFNTECENCQEEAKQISYHIKEFENYQVLMVSFEAKDKIIEFRNNYKLFSQSITFLQDSSYQFEDVFRNTSIPISLIYDKNRELIHKLNREVKVEALLKYLAE